MASVASFWRFKDRIAAPELPAQGIGWPIFGSIQRGTSFGSLHECHAPTPGRTPPITSTGPRPQDFRSRRGRIDFRSRFIIRGFPDIEPGFKAGRPDKLTPTPKGQGIFAPDRRRAGASVAGIIKQLPRAARTVPAALLPLQRQFFRRAELGDIGTSSLRRLDLKRRFIAGQADAMKAGQPCSPQPFNQGQRSRRGAIKHRNFMEMRVPAVATVGYFRCRHRPNEHRLEAAPFPTLTKAPLGIFQRVKERGQLHLAIMPSRQRQHDNRKARGPRARKEHVQIIFAPRADPRGAARAAPDACAGLETVETGFASIAFAFKRDLELTGHIAAMREPLGKRSIMVFQDICRRPLGREPGKVALMRCSVVNGFDVITKDRASRSRWPTSWTRRTRARRGIDGGRNGARDRAHFEIREFQHREPPRHLKDRRRKRINASEGSSLSESSD